MGGAHGRGAADRRRQRLRRLAERTIPSGTVALIFALVPLWIALWDRFVGHHRLPARVAVGLVLGFAGAALLVGDASVGGLPLSA